MSSAAVKNSITLKGSAAIIKDYLSKSIKTKNLKFQFLTVMSLVFVKDYGINSILFQRGIYPAETFNHVQQYGITVFMSKDEKIKGFLDNVLSKAEGLFST
jgi:mitotic spindle assembly checkpoint protein MAD2